MNEKYIFLRLKINVKIFTSLKYIDVSFSKWIHVGILINDEISTKLSLNLLCYMFALQYIRYEMTKNGSFKEILRVNAFFDKNFIGTFNLIFLMDFYHVQE